MSPMVFLMPRHVDPSAAIDPRLQAQAGPSGGSTAMKVAAVVMTIIASIGAFAALGPIAGIVTMIICGLGLMALFNSCCSGSHQHQGGTWFMHNPNVPVGNGNRRNQQPHVGVGQGHFQPVPQQQQQQPHVGVGQGHFQPVPQQPQGGHVGVGGGHNHNHGNGPVQPIVPTGPNGHVGVGRGHI